MQCLEKLLLNIILPVVPPQSDPLQFANNAKRGTEDAAACLLHLLFQHLDSLGNFLCPFYNDDCIQSISQYHLS